MDLDLKLPKVPLFFLANYILVLLWITDSLSIIFLSSMNLTPMLLEQQGLFLSLRRPDNFSFVIGVEFSYWMLVLWCPREFRDAACFRRPMFSSCEESSAV